MKKVSQKQQVFLFFFFIFASSSFCFIESSQAFSDKRKYQQFKMNAEWIDTPCDKLTDDFNGLKGKIEFFKLEDSKEQKTLHDLNNQYNKAMAIKMAHQGIRKLRDDFLGSMMGFHSEMGIEEKRETLGHMIEGLQSLKGMGEFLDPQRNELNDFRIINPNGTANDFLNYMKNKCSSSPVSSATSTSAKNIKISPFCEMIAQAENTAMPTSSATQDEKDQSKNDLEFAEQQVRGFYNIVYLGNFNKDDLVGLNNFYQGLNKDLGLKGFDNSRKFQRLKRGFEKLQKCQKEAHATVMCAETSQTVANMENDITNMQKKLEKSFGRNLADNLVRTTKDIFKQSGNMNDMNFFYRRIAQLKSNHYKKEIRDAEIHLKDTLIKACGKRNKIDLNQGKCADKKIELSSDTQDQVNQYQSEIENYQDKLNENRLEKSWQETVQMSTGTVDEKDPSKSRNTRKEFDNWLKETLTNGEYRQAWLQLTDPNEQTSKFCSSFFAQTDKEKLDEAAITKCVTATPDAANKVIAKQILDSYKKAVEEGKIDIKNLNAPLQKVAQDFLEILYRNWKNNKFDESYPMCPTLVAFSKDDQTKNKMPQLEMEQVADCLHSMKNEVLLAQEKKINDEITGLHEKMNKLSENPQLKELMTQAGGYIKMMTQKKCDGGNYSQELRDIIIPDCDDYRSTKKNGPHASASKMIDNVVKVTEKIENNLLKGKETLTQRKFMLEVTASSGEQTPLVERYQEARAENRAREKQVAQESNISPANFFMGGMMGMPMISSAIGQTSMMNYQFLMMQQMSTNMIYSRYGGFSSFSGGFNTGYSGFIR